MKSLILVFCFLGIGMSSHAARTTADLPNAASAPDEKQSEKLVTSGEREKALTELDASNSEGPATHRVERADTKKRTSKASDEKPLHEEPSLQR